MSASRLNVPVASPSPDWKATPKGVRGRERDLEPATPSEEITRAQQNGRFRLLLAVVAALALVIRLLHLSQVRSNPFFYHPIVDAWDYDVDAWAMVETGDWVGGQVFFQAPLMTYFLAVIYRIAGHNLLWPRLVQAAIGTASVVGVAALGRRLFGQRAAWIAGLGMAAYGTLVFFEGELLPPTVTVGLDVATFVVLFRLASAKPGWVWALPGGLAGLRALATTNNLATIPLFWGYILLRGRSLGWPRRQMIASGLAFTLAVVAFLAPAAIHNWVSTRHFVVVSSNSGLNFYLGNSGDYDGKVSLRPGADWEEFTAKHVQVGLKVGPEMSGYFFREAWKWIRARPGEYLRLLGYKLRLFLSGNEMLRNQAIYPFRGYSWILRLLLWKAEIPHGPGLAFPFGILVPLAFPGCLLVFRKRSLDAGFLLGYTLVYSLSVIAFFVTSRYRMPIVSPLVLLAAYGWANTREWWAPGRWRTAALSGMIALGLMSNWNPGRMPEDMNPDAYYSLAATHAQQGDLAGAERYYKRAIEMNPRDASAWVNLGLEVYEAKRLLAQAEAAYRKAISVRPDYGLAYYNLARLAEARGAPDEAERLYLEAVRLNPLMSAAYHNLATMALGRGDFDRAYGFYNQAYLIIPDNSKTLVGLAITSFRREGLEPALAFFDKARAIDPRNADIYYNMAIVYAEAGQPGESADALMTLLEIDPLDNEAYVRLAEQMRLAGRGEEARQLLERAARRWPQLTGPREGLTLLGQVD